MAAAAELVNSATSEKLTELDWAKCIQICELVANDQRQAKDVIKAIKKRLSSKNSNTQLFTIMLLEMLMNNIGDHVHRQVIDTGLLPVLVKSVKKKSRSPVREKIFLLLDATQTSLGGRSGRFPQYYSAYYELVSAGVQFPPGDHAISPYNPPISTVNTDASLAAKLSATLREGSPAASEPKTIPESSIIQKASSALEVLREVLDAIDSQHPEGAKDEFTLDLVEQCSFQKQRVMHLIMTSRDERVVCRAIDLNDHLEKVLDRHDHLISGRLTSTSNLINQEEVEEEEETEQLFRRIRKGKGHARPGDEDREKLICRPVGGVRLLESPSQQHALVIGPSLKVGSPHESDNNGSGAGAGAGAGVAIPPPPAKHIEREKFFQENNNNKFDGSGLATHVRGLSLHSHCSSSNSYNGSLDSD